MNSTCLLEEQDRCEEALPHLAKAVSLKQSDTRSKFRENLCRLALGQPEDARRAFVELLETSDSGWELGQAGYRAYETKQFELAEQLLRRAAEVDPNHESAFNDLGLVLLATDREEEARAAFERQIEIDPEGPYYYEIEAYDKALAIGAQAIQLAPDDLRLNTILGLLYSQKGKYKEALHYLEAAKKNTPGAFEYDDVLDYLRVQVTGQS